MEYEMGCIGVVDEMFGLVFKTPVSRHDSSAAFAAFAAQMADARVDVAGLLAAAAADSELAARHQETRPALR